MSNLTTFGSTQLTAADLRKVQSNTIDTGTVILKMDKTGYWVYGADQTEVADGTQWAVNPDSFIHGYIAWGDGEVLAEKMVSVSKPLPELEPAPAGAKKGWEPQLGVSFKAVSGEDEGLEVRYTTTSVGGKKALQKLANEVADQIETTPSDPIAVVTLGKESYQHKKYGKIFTPVIKVVDWLGVNGPAKATEASAGRQRRRA